MFFVYLIYFKNEYCSYFIIICIVLSKIIWFFDIIFQSNFASENITVTALGSILTTDYVDNVMNSSVYSGEYWTATFKDTKGQAIANTYVDVHFKKVGSESGVIYKVKSDNEGNVKLQLNLGYTGKYIVHAVFTGNSKYATSESKNITVNIIKADVKLVANYNNNTLETTNKSGENFTVQLLTTNNKVVKGAKLKINFTNSKSVGNIYTVTTNDYGFVYLPLNLAYIGDYYATVFFEGNSNYNPSQDSSTTSIKVVNKVEAII